MEKEFQEFFNELSNYERTGISIKLDEQIASPMQVVAAHMVQEDHNYMRDYIWDEQGRITELAFHNVKHN